MAKSACVRACVCACVCAHAHVYVHVCVCVLVYCEYESFNWTLSWLKSNKALVRVFMILNIPYREVCASTRPGSDSGFA